MRYVVDTNVAVVANGRDTNASLDCRLRAVRFLKNLCCYGRVILDYAGEIAAEYNRRLNPRGEPGVGDRFYLVVLQSSLKRVERVDLPKNPETGEFLDFPQDSRLVAFDRDDRKFAAAARKSGAPVANAVDSDWIHHRDVLNEHRVTIEFVCGCDPHKWFSDGGG